MRAREHVPYVGYHDGLCDRDGEWESATQDQVHSAEKLPGAGCLREGGEAARTSERYPLAYLYLVCVRACVCVASTKLLMSNYK